jgi:hypothetical protein
MPSEALKRLLGVAGPAAPHRRRTGNNLVIARSVAAPLALGARSRRRGASTKDIGSRACSSRAGRLQAQAHGIAITGSIRPLCSRNMRGREVDGVRSESGGRFSGRFAPLLWGAEHIARTHQAVSDCSQRFPVSRPMMAPTQKPATAFGSRQTSQCGEMAIEFLDSRQGVEPKCLRKVCR